MKRHNNLYRNIISIENIELAYKKSIKGKSNYKGVKIFNKDYQDNINKIHLSLLNKTFTTSQYKSKFIHEPKKREIFVLPFYPDRIVHHSLMNVLEPLLDKSFIYDSYCCRKNKGLHKGAKRAMDFVCKYNYCLKCDISKFYPSIDHDILYGLFLKKIKCKDTLWLLRDIIYSIEGGKNTPIGYYTSQWFGNFYMNVLDKQIKHNYKIKGYVRYCDDFCLFSNDKTKLKELSLNIKDFLKEHLQLSLSKCDLFPTKNGLDFLGYRYFPNGYILLRKSTSKRIKQKIKHLQYLIYNNKISYEKALSIISSIKGWLKWSNCFNFKNYLKLDDLNLFVRNGLKNA